MPSLPSSLALTSILDGSAIIAADHRNNYTAIQTDVNAVITALSGGTAGDTLTGVGTTLAYAKPPGYQFIRGATSSVSTISVTTEATASSVLQSGNVTYDGSTVVNIVAGLSVVISAPVAGDSLEAVWWDFTAGSSLGHIGFFPVFSTTIVNRWTVYAEMQVTPVAGARNYGVAAFKTGTSTFQIGGGTAAAGQLANAFVKVLKA